MTAPPEDGIGPDPHLNQRGVALTREQRRRLGVIGLVIAGGLLLALAGLRSGFPPGGGAAEATPYRIVLSGPQRALVSVAQDGAQPQLAEVALPYLVPIDPGASVVAVEARTLGRGAGAISCEVQRTSDGTVQQQRGNPAGAVECGAVLR